jgi:hypothetical protein
LPTSSYTTTVTITITTTAVITSMIIIIKTTCIHIRVAFYYHGMSLCPFPFPKQTHIATIITADGIQMAAPVTAIAAGETIAEDRITLSEKIVVGTMV